MIDVNTGRPIPDINVGMTLAQATTVRWFWRSPEAAGMACACVGPPWCCRLAAERADDLNRAAHIAVRQIADLAARMRAEP